VLAKEPSLSSLITDEREGMPSPSPYRHRFGSLLRAYSLIGYAPDRDYKIAAAAIGRAWNNPSRYGVRARIHYVYLVENSIRAQILLQARQLRLNRPA